MSLNTCIFLLSFLSLVIIALAQYDDYGGYRGLLSRNIGGCECEENNCGCCAHIHVPFVGLDDTACANLSYVAKDSEFDLSITLDTHVLYSTTLSALKPNRVCFGENWIRPLTAEVCLNFYDLKIENHKIHGCIKFEIEVIEMDIFHIKIGCYDFGSNFLRNNGYFNPIGMSEHVPPNKQPQVVIMIN